MGDVEVGAGQTTEPEGVGPFGAPKRMVPSSERTVDDALTRGPTNGMKKASWAWVAFDTRTKHAILTYQESTCWGAELGGVLGVPMI